MTAIFEHHVTVSDASIQTNNTAIAILFDSLEVSGNPLSKGHLKQAISKGALWLTRGKHTQRLRRVKKTLQAGDKLHLYYNEAVLGSEVNDAILISDESHYSIWYKPYGMLSQGSKWSEHCTIGRFVQQYFTEQRPAFVIHRLDRAATGLMLIAHSKKAARALSTMFEERTAQDNSLTKHYQIIVHGDHRLHEQPQTITSDVDGKNASSTFTCLSFDEINKQSLIEVKIDSGRKHQIRVHAASIGLPVVGDRLHGIEGKDASINLQLCAMSLRFNCPLSGEIKHFELPQDLRPQLLSQ